MSDVLCSVCREPWEVDSIHDKIAETYPDKPWDADADSSKSYVINYFDVAYATFRKIGCRYFGVSHGEYRDNGMVAALLEIAGDDVDFAAGMLEDAEWMGALRD